MLTKSPAAEKSAWQNPGEDLEELFRQIADSDTLHFRVWHLKSHCHEWQS